MSKFRTLLTGLVSLAGAIPAYAQGPISVSFAQPSVALAGEASQRVFLTGTGFASGMQVRVGNVSHAANVASSTSLSFFLLAEDLVEAGDVELRVATADDRVSNPLSFRINNPVPAISTTPMTFRTGSSTQTVEVFGAGFTRQSVLLWNGQPRAAQLNSSRSLLLQVPASDLATIGSATLSVRNPPPGGGQSESVFLLVSMLLNGATDLVWDDVGKRLLITDQDGLRTFDPQTGLLSAPILVTSRPGRMAVTADNSKLYVALNGELSLGRFSLPGLQLEAKYPIGTVAGAYAPVGGIEDIAIAPGRNDLVAAAVFFSGVSPRHAGVAVFDSNGRRPTMTANHTGSNVIAFDNDPSVFYGYNNESSESGYRKMVINPGGVTVEKVLASSFTMPGIPNFGPTFTIYQGKIFTGGQVLTPEPLLPVKTLTDTGTAAVNRKSGLVYIGPRSFSSSSLPVAVFRASTLERIGVSQSNVPGDGVARRFITWGEEGVAFLRDNDLYVLSRMPLSQSLASVPATSLVNAASFKSGAVAPGMIATLFGAGLGPASLAVAQPATQFQTSLAGVSVSFDGVPAPIIYAREEQLSFVIPFAIGGRTQTQMQVQYNGRYMPPVQIQVAASNPAIFTIPSGGSGQGAVLNQDYSLNSEGNAAERGSVIQVFMTGGGQTDPVSQDGVLVTGQLPRQVLPVTARIGGLTAVVEYAGPAPGAIAGLMQVNLRVPAATPGPRVPLLIQVGTVASPVGVTVAVR